MAEILVERFTVCPSGKGADIRAYEVLIVDDSILTALDRLPRVTTVQRIYSRGDLSIVPRVRELLVTTGRNAARTIIATSSTKDGHFDLDVSALGLTMAWYQDLKAESVTRVGWDFRLQPAIAAVAPQFGQLLTDHLVAQVSADGR